MQNLLEYSILCLRLENLEVLKALVSVYCRIWQEPPWYEMDWQEEEVLADFQTLLSRPGGSIYVAVADDQIVGFTAGWGIDRTDMERRIGQTVGSLFSSSQPIYYIAELGTVSEFRGHGIGKALSTALMTEAERQGFGRFALRTHVHADPARGLYARLGFEDTGLRDVEVPDRTYWVK